MKTRRINARPLSIFILFLSILFYCECLSEDFGKSQASMSRENGRLITLAEGLKLAIENNRLIKVASLNRDISSTDVLLARSKLLPSIDASLSQTYLANQPGARFGPIEAFTSKKEFLSYGISVYQTLFDFGATISQFKTSKISRDVSTLDISRIKNLVALDFINTYFDLLETEKMISVAQKEAESLASHLKVAQSLYKEGIITKNDLLQAEVTLSDAKQRLLTLKNIRSLNASRINTILARPIDAEVMVVDLPIVIPEGPKIKEAWEIAEKERAEIKIIDNELRILDMQETIKKSEYFPRLFAQGGYDYIENPFQLYEENWSLILGIKLNLFSGGSTKAEVAKVKYRRKQLLEQKSKLIEDIQLEVEKSYRDQKNALEKIAVTQDAMSQAEENLRINKVRYEEGIGTSTDVLDAITLLAKAETNYYRAVYDFNRAQAGLQYAMGLDLVSTYTP